MYFINIKTVYRYDQDRSTGTTCKYNTLLYFFDVSGSKTQKILKILKNLNAIFFVINVARCYFCLTWRDLRSTGGQRHPSSQFRPCLDDGKINFFFKAYRVLDEKIGSVFFVVEERWAKYKKKSLAPESASSWRLKRDFEDWRNNKKSRNLCQKIPQVGLGICINRGYTNKQAETIQKSRTRIKRVLFLTQNVTINSEPEIGIWKWERLRSHRVTEGDEGQRSIKPDEFPFYDFGESRFCIVKIRRNLVSRFYRC